MPTTKSPLRYPGGKTQFANLISGLILANGMKGCEYVEPYAGGAGVALRLLFDGTVERISLNDRDPAIYAFWRSVLDKPDKFCELIDTANLTIGEWRKQKAIYADPKSSGLALGFAVFYLNRTNRSGIIKADPIGGMAQDGEYLLGCRFPKERLKAKIKAIAKEKGRISFEELDAADFIRENAFKKNAFWFIDPPYYEKGKELYSNYYGPSGHADLANVIRTVLKDDKWVLTYDVCDEVRRLYEGFLCAEVPLRYSAGTKRVATELMFFNGLNVGL
jgi:DNA adenine methylase